jgi:hypothetical protein
MILVTGGRFSRRTFIAAHNSIRSQRTSIRLTIGRFHSIEKPNRYLTAIKESSDKFLTPTLEIVFQGITMVYHQHISSRSTDERSTKNKYEENQNIVNFSSYGN